MELNKVVRTDSENIDFKDLTKLLDGELALHYGEIQKYYDNHNILEDKNSALLLYSNGSAVACVAMKPFDVQSMEVKRMYTLPEKRGNGYASTLLTELESWAKEMGFSRCILETGNLQDAAIKMYEKCGYDRIDNYGPYIGIESSYCFQKFI